MQTNTTILHTLIQFRFILRNDHRVFYYKMYLHQVFTIYNLVFIIFRKVINFFRYR